MCWHMERGRLVVIALQTQTAKAAKRGGSEQRLFVVGTFLMSLGLLRMSRLPTTESVCSLPPCFAALAIWVRRLPHAEDQAAVLQLLS